MAEWFIAPISKIGDCNRSEGSNPSYFVLFNVWRGGREVYGASLENLKSEMVRGFKSHPLR